MSTPRILTPRRLPLPPSKLLLPHRRAPPRRSFITLPDASKPQHVTAARRLPYDHARLYDLIADVDSYVRFLPYCKVSRVTQWTARPDANGRRWPTRADLTAGWGGVEETYTSRVFCVPHLGVVEAISGDAATEIAAADLREQGLADPGPEAGGGGGGGVFESLVTRWTVSPAGDASRADRFQHGWSDVRLSIRYRFANPLYTAISGAVADRVAPVMIEAFVEQARRILGETGKDAETLR
ncbi:dehydrase and lipid transport-domain-containing protein [Hypoxylon cercidicola]|nr:dehydrase and lipid transport-domain-containing protein [Hypoxylon cercidicola]